MKICSIITGATRPTAGRVFENLNNTLSVLSKYNCKHYVLTYRTEESIELKRLVEENDLDVDFHLLEPITETIGSFKGNNYRMFRCIEVLGDKVENLSSFDCVIRHRIDCELQEIDIPTNIQESVYYAPSMNWGPIFDNIGLMSPSVFQKVFRTEGKDFNEPAPHETLEDAIAESDCIKKPFNFKIKLYQSDDPEFMGIEQWSRQDRTFHYNDNWITLH